MHVVMLSSKAGWEERPLTFMRPRSTNDTQFNTLAHPGRPGVQKRSPAISYIMRMYMYMYMHMHVVRAYDRVQVCHMLENLKIQ